MYRPVRPEHAEKSRPGFSVYQDKKTATKVASKKLMFFSRSKAAGY
jgi:hypothetical protein